MRTKTLLALLLLSAALNLGLVGFVLGRWSQGGPALPGDGTTLMSLRLLHSLPESRREALHGEVRAYFRAVRPAVRELRQQQRQLLQAIAAEPFDAAAVTQALEQLGGQTDALRSAGQAPFVALLSRLTAEERRLLIERPPGPPGHRRPWHHRPEAPEAGH